MFQYNQNKPGTEASLDASSGGQQANLNVANQAAEFTVRKPRPRPKQKKENESKRVNLFIFSQTFEFQDPQQQMMYYQQNFQNMQNMNWQQQVQQAYFKPYQNNKQYQQQYQQMAYQQKQQSYQQYPNNSQNYGNIPPTNTTYQTPQQTNQPIQTQQTQPQPISQVTKGEKNLTLKERLAAKNKKIEEIDNFQIEKKEEKIDQWGEIKKITEEPKQKTTYKPKQHQDPSQTSTQPASNQKTEIKSEPIVEVPETNIELTIDQIAEFDAKKREVELEKERHYLQVAPANMNNEWLLKFILKGQTDVEYKSEKLDQMQMRKRFEVMPQRQQNQEVEFKQGKYWVAAKKDDISDIKRGKDYNKSMKADENDDWGLMRNYDENYHRKMEFTEAAKQKKLLKHLQQELPEDQQAIKEVKGILNKIAEKNIEFLSKDILQQMVKNEYVLEQSVDAIVQKAISDQKFTLLYAKLCSIFKNNQEVPRFIEILLKEIHDRFSNKKMEFFQFPNEDEWVQDENEVFYIQEKKKKGQNNFLQFLSDCINIKVLAKKSLIRICSNELIQWFIEGNNNKMEGKEESDIKLTHYTTRLDHLLFLLDLSGQQLDNTTVQQPDNFQTWYKSFLIAIKQNKIVKEIENIQYLNNENVFEILNIMKFESQNLISKRQEMLIVNLLELRDVKQWKKEKIVTPSPQKEEKKEQPQTVYKKKTPEKVEEKSFKDAFLQYTELKEAIKDIEKEIADFDKLLIELNNSIKDLNNQISMLAKWSFDCKEVETTKRLEFFNHTLLKNESIDKEVITKALNNVINLMTSEQSDFPLFKQVLPQIIFEQNERKMFDLEDILFQFKGIQFLFKGTEDEEEMEDAMYNIQSILNPIFYYGHKQGILTNFDLLPITLNKQQPIVLKTEGFKYLQEDIQKEVIKKLTK